MPLLHHATPKNCVEIAISMAIMAMRDVRITAVACCCCCC